MTERIQIQLLLKLNVHYLRVKSLEVAIQIQLLLKLNIQKADCYLEKYRIQIQLLLKLNDSLRVTDALLTKYSNTTLVKVKFL